MHSMGDDITVRGLVICVRWEPASLHAPRAAAAVSPFVMRALVSHRASRPRLLAALRVRQPNIAWPSVAPAQLAQAIAAHVASGTLRVLVRTGAVGLGPGGAVAAAYRDKRNPSDQADGPQAAATRPLLQQSSPAVCMDYRLRLRRGGGPKELIYGAVLASKGRVLCDMTTDGSPCSIGGQSSVTWQLKGLVEAAHHGTLEAWGDEP